MRRSVLIATLLLGLAATSLGLASPPASAALSNVSLVASNNQVDATGVTYTVVFRTGLADAGLVLALPAEVTGLSTANVAVSTSSDGLTFSAATLAGANGKLLSADGQRVAVNLAAAVTPGTWVKIAVSGLSNPAAVGSGTVDVGGSLTAVTQSLLDTASLNTLLALLAETAGATVTWVAQVANGVTQSVSVAPALTFAIGAASHSFSLDPSGTTSSTSSETLTVATNAGTYAIQAKVSGDLVRAGSDGSAGADVLSVSAPQNGPHFGYKVSAPSGDTGGVDAAAYRTFSTGFTSLVSGWALSGLTNGEATTVTYDAVVDYTKAPGTYVGTVTYRIVPTY